jgi:hypothetical protein
MSELHAHSLFTNRWDITNFEEHRDAIEKAILHAWEALIDFGQTYEYKSIMSCAGHLISLFIEDHPNQYNVRDIGLTALKIAYIQLSQGIFEDPTIYDFGISPSKKLLEIEILMLSYPYNRCFSLMETELMRPRDVYNLTLQLIKRQIGDRYLQLNIKRLNQQIYDYYEDLQTRPFFEHEIDPYISIGGSPSFAENSYYYIVNKPPTPSNPSKCKQPKTLLSQKYPPYLDQNDIPNI